MSRTHLALALPHPAKGDGWGQALLRLSFLLEAVSEERLAGNSFKLRRRDLGGRKRMNGREDKIIRQRL